MKLKANFFAPLLFAAVAVLAGFSESILNLIRRFSADTFLSTTIIQLLVYLIPLAFYCKGRGIDLASGMKMRGFAVKKIPFIVVMMLIFFAGSCVLRYFGLFYFDSAMVNTPSAVYFEMENGNRFLTVFCSILLPAILEEIVFRGVILEEYRSYGSVWAVTLSSLLFAMLHLSWENLLYYFFMGVVFSVIAVAADSLVPTMAIHILVNFSYFYVRPSLVEYLRQAGKSPLLPYLMIAVFLLLFVMMFSRLEDIYRTRAYDEMLQSRKELLRKEVERAKKEREELDGVQEENSKEEFLSACKELILSPTFLGGVAIFALLSSNVF